MGAGPQSGGKAQAVEVENEEGTGPIVFVCDHASNFLPPPYDTSLGLSEADKTAHIAWDPGALGVAKGLSKALDAPLVYTTVSRLIIDCNREETRPDLTPCLSETTEIAGNKNLSDEERDFRLNLAHRPFHNAIDRVVGLRRERGQPTAVVSIHTFTPVYKGKSRPWEIGLISDVDRRLADPVIAELVQRGDLTVGDNEPYAPSDGVYYTIRRHGENHGFPCLMIEIRNNEVRTAVEESRWSDMLAPVLERAAQSALKTGSGDAHA